MLKHKVISKQSWGTRSCPVNKQNYPNRAPSLPARGPPRERAEHFGITHERDRINEGGKTIRKFSSPLPPLTFCASSPTLHYQHPHPPRSFRLWSMWRLGSHLTTSKSSAVLEEDEAWAWRWRCRGWGAAAEAGHVSCTIYNPLGFQSQTLILTKSFQQIFTTWRKHSQNCTLRRFCSRRTCCEIM